MSDATVLRKVIIPCVEIVKAKAQLLHMITSAVPLGRGRDYRAAELIKGSATSIVAAGR